MHADMVKDRQILHVMFSIQINVVSTKFYCWANPQQNSHFKVFLSLFFNLH